MHSIQLKQFVLGKNQRPFVIAEMSGNHNQSLERALRLVDAAAAAGVQALKLQTYTADTMTLDIDAAEFYIDDPHSLWQGNSLYNLYQQAYTPWEWHKPIFDRCREQGILGFSTPFDDSAVDFLESLAVPAYKIASFELTDLPLIRKVATTGKPMIMSTGMATIAEIDEAVSAARGAGCTELVLLKCTSTYPASPENSHLLTLPHLSDLFGCPVGISDHTLGIGVSLAAVALGAVVIEKHFTLSRAEGGVDSAFSLEPAELTALVRESVAAWQALGQIHYGPTEAEKPSLKHRRSLYIVEDLQAGDVLTAENVRAIRPGLGLSPKFYEVMLGKRVKNSVAKGTPVAWNLL